MSSNEAVMPKSTLGQDVEKSMSSSSIDAKLSGATKSSVRSLEGKNSIWDRLTQRGVEIRGAAPVAPEDRNDTRFINVFTIFSTSMLSLLPIGTGIVPTFFYGLSLRNAFLCIFFFVILFCIPPAWIITFAPRTGMRQMVQSRYSFGYWPNIIITLLTMLTVGGFCVIASSIGGQCLSTVNPDKVSKEVGIVIIIIPSIFMSFGGYKVLHAYQRWAWIPTLILIIITIGYGGKGLKAQATPAAPEAPTVINTIALMAGYMISWGNVVGDYCVYMPANAPKWRLFSYCMLGLCTPIILLLTFGAAIGGAILSNPTWLAGYHATSTGGVLGAMLEPAGRFGKFVLVLLAFSVVGTCSREIYTISVDFQVLIPKAHKVPRVIWVFITAGAIIGIAIGAVEHFYTALSSFLDFIGYWSASYIAIIMLEFMYFRKSDPTSYDITIWNSPSSLPPGIAAAAAALLPWALIVPAMAEDWYTGPIAKVTGDLGNEFAGILTILLYIPLRTLEVKWRKGVN